MVKQLRKYFMEFLRAQEGNVIFIVSLGAFMLVIAAGTAIDMSRAEILQMKISSALDAAGLAAGKASLNVPADANPTAYVQQVAQQYFNANFSSGYLESTPNINVQATLSSNNTVVNLTATTTQATSIMPIIGVNTITVAASSQVTHGQLVPMELVMALDNTGSMSCDVSGNSCTSGPSSKIAALKTAAATLVNTLIPENSNNKTVFIGLVPFTSTVNVSGVPGAQSNWLNPQSISNDNNAPGGWGPGGATFSSSWAGCVEARPYPYDVTDDAPGAGNSSTLFPPFYYAAVTPYIPTLNEWVMGPININNIASFNPTSFLLTPSAPQYDYAPSNFVYFSDGTSTGFNNTAKTVYGVNQGDLGPNLDCPSAITPMTSQSNTILQAINNMYVTGDTNIDIGAAWGWRMLSPNWNGLWGPNMTDMNGNNLPLPYSTPSNINSIKVLVLMSDGWNKITPEGYTSYGYSFDPTQLGNIPNMTPSSAIPTPQMLAGEAIQESILDMRTLWVCNSLKANSVIVYTIALGENGAPPPQDNASANYDLLRQCATDPGHFFPAPTTADLQAAFESIADSLVNLRVSQ